MKGQLYTRQIGRKEEFNRRQPGNVLDVCGWPSSIRRIDILRRCSP
ncbi:hypothetical protein RSOL_321910 [Rhizoctonia solani AG-3 Rhs1AP]|uniref:Uncharacterized protein n=1 Tax=Rhizoctonia solani AG-3 Rhs1AP TaxID=1086054 RepID=A0A0A1UKY3_9AGAM|nr:hypothetical protein RSOL_321910 [Rhizoctonia solani AG-3 Rhs1AP]